jgi:MFS transporter, ACS family, aldohexuronate transporter
MRFWSKWGLCILLFLATTLNYLDRQVLSVLAPTVQAELHFGNEKLGWLFSVFYITYAVGQMAVGTVLDRTNLRIFYAFAVVAWSLVSAGAGLATGFVSLLVLRGLLGVMEAPNWPSALRILSRALPPKERTLGNGIFTSGTSVGALIAPALSLGIAEMFGWRWAFIALGGLGLLWFAVWMVFTRSADMKPAWTNQADPAAAQKPGTSRLQDYGLLLRSPRFWFVWLTAITINPCLYFTTSWLPTYFAQVRGLTAGPQTKWILTTVYLCLDLGYLSSGAVVLLLSRMGRSVRTARRATFMLATALVCVYPLVSGIQGLTNAVVAIGFVNFGLGLWIAIYLTMAQEVSRDNVATAAGVLGGSGSAIGALAMWAVGRVTANGAGFSVPMIAVTTATLVAAMSAWVATSARMNPEEPKWS